MIEVVRAPAYATVQDAGRDGFRSSGVPSGGAMDLLSLFAGNVLVGNDPGAAAIEWALTGGSLRFRHDTTFALTGATTDTRLNDYVVPHGRTLRARSGDVLTIDAITAGRFLYLCFHGGVDVPVVLGGRGSYLPGAFGGLDGRRLAAGDVISLGRKSGAAPRDRELPRELNVLGMRGSIGLMRGPQADGLSPGQWRALTEHELVVSPHSDRTGYRLSGLESVRTGTSSAKSEPSCAGAVQLTPAGELIVLMADGPTVGGYPKIGVVAAGHLPRLAQTAVGARVQLRVIETREAVAVLATHRSELRKLAGHEFPAQALDSRT